MADKLTPKERAIRLAQEASTVHNAIRETMRTNLERAREAGSKLCKAKTLLKETLEEDNGQGKVKWKKWLSKHFHASYETAVVYMRISRNWTKLYGPRATDPDLTIEEALQILRHKRPQRQYEEWWNKDEQEAFWKVRLKSAEKTLRKLTNRTIWRWRLDDERFLVFIAEKSEIVGTLFRSWLERLHEELCPLVEVVPLTNREERDVYLEALWAFVERDDLTEIQLEAISTIAIPERKCVVF